jgi:hypothetical protein
MKKNKSLILVIVLVVLVGAFAIVKYTGNSGRSKSFRSSLVEINDQQVTKVEILTPSDTTLLEKTGDAWMVDKDKKGDSSTIQTMLKTLQSISPSRLASRSEDDWNEYQVDNQGTRVVAYEGSSKVLDIVLGKFNVEGQRSYYSYVRLTEDEDVYIAKDFMKMGIGADGASYRNDDVLRVNKDSVTSIAFNYPDSAFNLVKADQGWIIGEVKADSAAVAKYLQSIAYVTSRNFSDDAATAGPLDVSYTLTNGEVFTIMGNENSGFSSSYNPDEYWEDKNTYDKVFEGRSYFLSE